MNLFVIPALLALAMGDPQGATASDAALSYQLSFDPASDPPRWLVSLDARGLDPSEKDVAFVLNDWGEWSEVAEQYLLSYAGSPDLVRAPGTGSIFKFEPPSDWQGDLHFEYELALLEGGSELHSKHALLPHISEGYAFGYSNNTLARLQVAGQPSGLSCTIQLSAPQSWEVVTGWNGQTAQGQTISFCPEDTALLAFGQEVIHESRRVGEQVHEFHQFGGGVDLSEEVLSVQTALLPIYEKAWSTPLAKTSRVFLVKHHLGGTRMDHGVVVGFGPDHPERFIRSPYILHLLAHEFFHEWLGGKLLREDASLVWFGEGFTEYLSLFYSAKAQLVSESWFVDRMVELAQEAAYNSSLGRLAFGDAQVNWRDADGPNETMAYKGGALLAFAMDTELRKAGQPGLMSFMNSLYASSGGRYSLDNIRAEIERLELQEFYERYILGTEIPNLEEAFTVAGVPMVPVDCQLTYFGMRTDGVGEQQVVAELDPKGPALRAGARVGDRILSHSGGHRRGVQLKDSVTTPFDYGLSSLDPDEVVCTLQIERAGEPLELSIAPALIEGGTYASFEYEPGGMDDFFQ